MSTTDPVDTKGFPEDLPEDPQESYRREQSTAWRKPKRNAESSLSTWGIRQVMEQETIGLDQDRERERAAPPPDSLPMEPQHGHSTYMLRQCVGMGGFGEVWEAIQVSLGRTVAVKKIQESHYSEIENDIEEVVLLDNQFRQEAYITGQLDHPNIVPIYDLGVDAKGHPLLAMKLVKGTPWNQLLRSDSDQMDLDEYLHKHLAILIDVAQAVAFAHSRMIVHRDLKPSQVIVGEFGEVLLMDWGLAVFVGDPDEDLRTLNELKSHIPTPITASSPGGTPCLMAPEQTEPTAEEISPATDMYLLGGCLYFILTGTYPHDDRTSYLSMARARKGEVVDPRERVAGRYIPAELAELSMHCLRRLPKERLQTPALFIAAIRDYMSGSTNRRESLRLTARVADRLVGMDTGIHPKLENTPAHQTHGRAENIYGDYTECLNLLQQSLAKWSRNPDVESLRGLVLTRYARGAISHGDLTLAGALAEQMQNQEDADQIREEVAELRSRTARVHRQRRLAVVGSLILMSILVGGGMQYAFVQRSNARQLGIERDFARTARESADRAKGRAMREQYFSNIGIAAVTLEQGRVEKTRDILLEQIPPNFAQWEWGYLFARLSPEDMTLGGDQSFHAVFSPDGNTIVSGGVGSISRWDAHSGRQIWSVATNDPKKSVWQTAISPDGKWIAGASSDTTGVLLEADTGRVVRKLEGSTKALRTTGFSPDSTRVFTGGTDGSLRVWDVATGEQKLKIDVSQDDVYDARYSPDGRTILAGTLDFRATLWDATTGAFIREYPGHTDNVLSVAFSPDGKLVVTGCSDRQIRVFETDSAKLVRSMTNENAFIHCVDVSPDGTMIAAADESGRCTIWDTHDGSLRASVLADDPMWKVRFGPWSQRLVTTSRRSVRVFSLDRIDPHPILNQAPTPEQMRHARAKMRVFGASTTRDAAWNDKDKAWLVPSGATLAPLSGNDYLVLSAQSDFDAKFERRLDVDRKTRSARVYDAATGAELAKLGDDTGLVGRFNPDASVIAVAEFSELIHLYDAKTYQLLGDLKRPAEVRQDTSHGYDMIRNIEFSPDGRFLCAAYNNDELVLWDMQKREISLTFERVGRPGVSLCFAPDGSMLASGGSDDHIILWETLSGRCTATLKGHQRSIVSVDFHPDGTRLISCSKDGTVKLWETHTGREVLTVHSDKGGSIVPLAARFTPDGSDAVIATTEGRVMVAESFPWNKGDYPGADTNLTLDQQVELWKRRHRMGPTVAASDLQPIATDAADAKK